MTSDPTKEYHDAPVRVRYAETDQMGVVYHANYLIWFEIGRVELMRALGFEYKLMEAEDDCYIVVVRRAVVIFTLLATTNSSACEPASRRPVIAW